MASIINPPSTMNRTPKINNSLIVPEMFFFFGALLRIYCLTIKMIKPLNKNAMAPVSKVMVDGIFSPDFTYGARSGWFQLIVIVW